MRVFKRKNGDIETFEIPDSVLLELQKLSSGAGEAEVSPSTTVAIDLFKMEYERCAQRYNDLYNSAWTNFSYMVLVAGGILTFGGERFISSVTVFLACLPLLFWWAATFVPLNRYGDDVQDELVRIEEALFAIGVFDGLKSPADKGLRHFQNFSKRGKKRTARDIPAQEGYDRKNDNEPSLRETYWRVRNVVLIAAVLLVITAGTCGVLMVLHVIKGESLTVREKPTVTLTVAPVPSPMPNPNAK